MDHVEDQQPRAESLPEVCPICGNPSMSRSFSDGGLLVRLSCSVCNLKWNRWLGMGSRQWDQRDSRFAGRFSKD